MPPRENDPQINDDVVLWRAVPLSHVCVGGEGAERPESWAFKSADNEVSCWIAAEMDLQDLKARFPNFRIAQFTAGQARECANIVTRDPVEGDAAHVLVCPTPGKSLGRVTKDARRLASKATLLPAEEV
jgi:hypothetical protein